MSQQSTLASAKGRLFAADLSVADLMSRELRTLPATATLQDLADLLERHEIRHAPIVNKDGKLAGLMTHRDLLRLMRAPDKCGSMDRRLKDLMQDEVLCQVKSVRPETSARTAAIMLWERKIGCLPVVDADNVPVGMLTESDFVKFFADGV